MTAPARLELGQHAAGLVVMLDAAGRTIAGLEDRVDQLTANVRALEADRQRLAQDLHNLRDHIPDAADVPHHTDTPAENGDHASPAHASAP